MTTASTCTAERSFIAQHFTGTIAARDEHTMREHIATCTGCRAHYRRHSLFASLDPNAKANAPSAEDRIARGLGLPAPSFEKKKRQEQIVRLFSGAALALAASVLLLLQPPASSSSGFTARGSIPSPTTTTTLSNSPSIGVYRIPPDANALPLASTGSTIHRDDELAFTYKNMQIAGDSEVKTHLMVFGVDAQKRVYWFHPAWSNERENPVSVAIEVDDATSIGARSHELREAIRHHFEGDRLEVHGLFTTSPISVREAEAALKRRATQTGPLTMKGGVDHVIELRVESSWGPHHD